MRDGIVFKSAIASLAFQVLIGVVTLSTYFVPNVNEEVYQDIAVILTLELISQTIEFVWYAAVLYYRKDIKTWSRYLDWFLSTPVMLVSTIMFFLHRRRLELYTCFLEPPLYVCLASNWVMLCFGLASELKIIGAKEGALLGTAFLMSSFVAMSYFLGKTPGDELSVTLYSVMYVVWTLYGVAALLKDEPKNVMYNCLDVVSKNFYGLFLFGYLISLSS
jgi:bacteriorhodopsin